MLGVLLAAYAWSGHSQQLRNAARVPPAGLDRHGRERRLDVPCFQRHRTKACLAQPAVEPLRHWTGFQAGTGGQQPEPAQECNPCLRIARRLGLAHAAAAASRTHRLPSRSDTSIPTGCSVAVSPDGRTQTARTRASRHHLGGKPTRNAVPMQAHYRICRKPGFAARARRSAGPQCRAIPKSRAHGGGGTSGRAARRCPVDPQVGRHEPFGQQPGAARDAQAHAVPSGSNTIWTRGVG